MVEQVETKKEEPTEEQKAKGFMVIAGFCVVCLALTLFVFVVASFDRKWREADATTMAEYQANEVFVMDKISNGGDLTLTELSRAGIVKVYDKSFEHATRIWLKSHNIHPGQVDIQALAEQEREALMSYPIKIPAIKLPATTEKEK